MKLLCDSINEAQYYTITKCKVCGSSANFFGAVDFNKNCAGRDLGLSNIPICYHRCQNCGLIFTKAFDHWSKEDFLFHIYNDEYITVDPGYVSSRPKSDALELSAIIKQKKDLKILDYGGGNGTCAVELRHAGFDADFWDPISLDVNEMPDKNAYDVVSAFEVFEHTPTPIETFAEALSFMKKMGGGDAVYYDNHR